MSFLQPTLKLSQHPSLLTGSGTVPFWVVAPAKLVLQSVPSEGIKGNKRRRHRHFISGTGIVSFSTRFATSRN
jgi:hypothetical protein